MDSHQLLSGRPYGGCGILYRKSLSPLVRRIFTDSKHFCALSITLNSSRDNSPFVILLLCVYLPPDFSSADSHPAFLKRFDNIIIAGDFNLDFARHRLNYCNLYAFVSLFQQINKLVFKITMMIILVSLSLTIFLHLPNLLSLIVSLLMTPLRISQTTCPDFKLCDFLSLPPILSFPVNSFLFF